MSKKILMLLTLVVFQILFLFGCKQTPQKVQDRMKNYGDNSQINEEVELEYCTVDELKKKDLTDISGEYNISIPKKFDCSGITDISILNMQYESGCFNLKDKYVELFGVDKDSLKYRAADDEGEEYIYESDDKKARKYFALSENGFVSYICDTSYDYTEDKISNIETYATYNMNFDDVSDKTIVFNEGPVPFNDIITDSVNWAQEHFGIKDMNYGVIDIYERRLKTDEGVVPQMSLLLGLYYNGVLLEPYVIDFDKDDSGNYCTKAANCKVEFNYEGKDKITFAALQTKYKLNSVKAVDKVITPECALKIINKTFSGFGRIEASDFRVIYGLFPSSGPVESNEDINHKEAELVEGRPVYAFWINKDSNGISDFGMSILPEHYIYVDMITGEIITNYKFEQQDK